MTGFPATTSDLPDLLPRIRSEDDKAFATLVATYQPLVFRWAVALAEDHDEADDVTQEVFVRVHRKIGTYRGDGPFEAWLYRITRRVILRTRAKATYRRAQIAATTAEVYVTDPGIRVDQQRAVDLIRGIARALPMRQREVFMLCDLEGRTPAEAAALLDMKDVSVRASLFKARTAIRRSILMTHPHYTEPPQ